jgi:hypothetical protein
VIVEGLALLALLVTLLVLRDLVIRWLADRRDARDRGVGVFEARLLAVESLSTDAHKTAISTKKALEAGQGRVRR